MPGGLKIGFRAARGIAVAVAILRLCGAAAAQQNDVPGALRALVESGAYREAYALGSNAPERLGDPAFDFLFGVAAIESGHAGEGVLALERYLYHDPRNRTARLLLARGYFLLEENRRARDEFEAVLAADAGAERVVIERYLDAIRGRESLVRPSASGYVELGAGRDSNANSGVANSLVSLPVFGVVDVVPTGIARADSFASVTAGAQASYPVARGVALVGNANLESRRYGSATEFDQGLYGAAGGVSCIAGEQLWRATAGRFVQDFGGSRLRTVTGINADWARNIGANHLLAIGLQNAALDYAGINRARNATYQGAGANWRWSLPFSMQPMVSVALNSARERTRDSERDDLSRNIAGWRLALSAAPAARLSASLGIGAQRSIYLQPDLILATIRQDRYTAADVTAAYAWDRHWSARFELIASHNSSNLELYTYRRTTGSLKLRYDF